MRTFLILILFSSSVFAKNIKTFELNQDKIYQIKTSPGYSTVISFPTKVMQVILGDSELYKVEYVPSTSEHLTIKPLSYGAKSNLFVLTAFGKTSIELLTTKPSEANYIVKFQYPIHKKKDILPRSFLPTVVVKNKSIEFKLDKIFNSKHGTVINFYLKNITRTKIQIKEILIIQDKHSINFSSLYADRSNIQPKSEIFIQIVTEELKPKQFSLKINDKFIFKVQYEPKN